MAHQPINYDVDVVAVSNSPYVKFDAAVNLLVEAAHLAVDQREWHCAKRAITALAAISPTPRYNPRSPDQD